MDQSLLDQATRLIEIERAQIGHEIHDALLPLIFAASASLSSADQSDPRLQQAAKWLDDAMHTGRRLLTELYPPDFVGSLWTRSARDTIERLFDDRAKAVLWDVAGEVEQVSQPTAFALYRIVVEATRNAIQHGHASNVSVSGAVDNDSIQVSVEDNGKGFDPNLVPEDRFGIRTMTSRASLVGGSLTVSSTPEQGTTITVNIPSV